MPSPGYVSPNTPKGLSKSRDRWYRDIKKHDGKLTSRSKADLRARLWMEYLKRHGQRA